MKKFWYYITTRRLLVILLILFIVTSGALLFFITRNQLPDDPKGEIKLAIIKSLLEVSVIAIIGGTVAAIFKSHERHQEDFRFQLQQKEEQAGIRAQKKIEFIKRLGEFYRTAKSTRRKLRTKGIRAFKLDEIVPLDKGQLDYYEEQMDVINEVQLELEGLKAEAGIPLLFEKKEQIVMELGKMEDCLGKIHSEFEEHNQSLRKEVSPNLDTLEYLKEFTFSASKPFVFKKNSPVKDYRFKTHFSVPYHNILENFL